MGILQKVASFFGLATNQRLVTSWVNGQLVLYKQEGDTYLNEGYLTNEQVYSVIGWIIKKGVSVPFEPLEIKDRNALKKYITLTSEGVTKENYFQARLLKTKALGQTTKKASIINLFNQPNPRQTEEEFRQWFIGFRLIMGEAFVYKILGIGDKAIEMWPLRPKEVELEQGKEYLEILNYIWTGGGSRVGISPNQCYHSKYFNPENPNGGEELRGLSPLRAMLRTVQESNEYTKQSLIQSQNAGPPQIISSNADMGEMEGMALKEAVSTKWRESNRIPFVTSANIDVHALGMSPADLKLLEGRLFTLRTFCDGYHIPSEIFNDPTNKTFANKTEAKRAGIQDAVVPELIAYRNLWNSEAIKEGIFYDYDISVLPEMQIDHKEMAAALKDQWYVTGKQKQIFMGWDEDLRPEVQEILNAYMIPSDVTPHTMLVDPTLQTDPANDGSIV